ncbi:hypothetical protein [Spirosoma sp. 48-14]|uniref:hypothetical protein n=1 Tax=Spirosoma sp. 48-14 TaxID=1895854 RepID=UPI0025E6EBF7|nr:hypothetical protein [Spirosoma sp. 48-14]
MNKKSSTDTSFVNFKKRFPTSKDFVDWLLANPDKGKSVSYEERMHNWSEQLRKAGRNMR